MGRKPRIIYSGALYHITQRGNNHNYIYEDVADKKEFFSYLLEAKESCGFQILFYVLMDNHYHLILEAGEMPIWKGIQRLNTTYSKYYNKKYNRSGGIYEGRYTCSLISDTKYYYQLLKYIALNPVKAGIVKNPNDYKWSAHPEICKDNGRIVAVQKCLSFFPGPQSKARQEYIKLIEKELEVTSDYGLAPVKESVKLRAALNYLLENLEYSDEICNQIKQGDRNRNIKVARDQFIHKAYQAGFTVKEISEYLALSYESVRKVVKSFL